MCARSTDGDVDHAVGVRSRAHVRAPGVEPQSAWLRALEGPMAEEETALRTLVPVLFSWFDIALAICVQCQVGLGADDLRLWLCAVCDGCLQMGCSWFW